MPESVGISHLCDERAAKAAMLAHLRSCAPKHDLTKGPATDLFQLHVEAKNAPLFWLDVEIITSWHAPSTARVGLKRYFSSVQSTHTDCSRQTSWSDSRQKLASGCTSSHRSVDVRVLAGTRLEKAVGALFVEAKASHVTLLRLQASLPPTRLRRPRATWNRQSIRAVTVLSRVAC